MAAKNKGLGKGIGALFPEDFSSFEEDLQQEIKTTEQAVQELPLKELRPNPYQPRRHFDEEALKELADSIKVQGLVQPIVVRPSTIKGYEIIAGERRFRAMKMLNQETIPSIIKELDDSAMMQLALIENLQREDLTVIEEGEAYRKMLEVLHFTQNDLAEKMGKSRSYIANTLRLLDLSDEIKTLLVERKLSAGHARALLSLKEEDRLTFVHKILEEGLSVRQLEKAIKAFLNPSPKPQKPLNQEKPLFIKEAEEHLMDKFGTNVSIKAKGNKGKIEIDYLSQEELTHIFDVLNLQFED